MPSVPDSSIDIGLAALEQGDYTAAIAHLEAACLLPLNQSAQVKAQMGLVVAYKQTGEISQALALCQILSTNIDTQIREWAVQNYTELTKHYSTEQTPDDTAIETDITGFIPFNNQPQSNPSIANISTPSHPANLSPTSLPSVVDESDKNLQKSEVSSQETQGNIPTPYAPFKWQQTARAKRWQNISVSTVNLLPFWALQVGTAIALFWLIREVLKLFMAVTNNLLVKLPILEPFQPFYHDPSPSILLTLGILLCLSPWLLDQLLRLFYTLQPLSVHTLSTYSPEASRVLQRYCRQQGWSLPRLGILPTSAPVAFSYGNLPRTARIVVSQGLLKQLADDEIATIYACQLGHIAHWDFVFMSLVMLLTQLPYIVYRQVSHWGDKTSNQILRTLAAAIATFAYGIWYLLNLPALWLSQVRIYYSDYFAANITGNPNGLTRALLKIAQGIAADIQKQEHTSWLLESWNLLLPISYYQALTLGSITSWESFLAWDCVNPYRYLLSINNTHPLIGDRLQRLARISRHWHLQTELNLATQLESPPSLQQFLLQSAPFLGIFLGLLFGGLIWLIGAIALMLQFPPLAWMYGDWSIIKSCLLLGFSIGTFVRINSLFPDLKPAVQNSPSLEQLLADKTAIPVNSQPVRIQGKLLGRRGVSNCLGQDLILQSSSGLIKLHHVSGLGPFASLLPKLLNPTELLGRHIVTGGWLRRGATSWLDIDSLRTQGGQTIVSEHPIWSTVLASLAAAWAVYLLLRGEP